MADTIEMMDIYDRERRKTGEVLPRKGTFLNENQYMLYVLAIIERPDHRILITQRAMDKKWAAGWWEISGGGSLAGESSFDAVCREVREETGLDVSNCVEKKPVYSYRNDDFDRGDNYFVDIYHFHLDFKESDLKIQKEEAINKKLATFEEITEMNAQKQFLHYSRIQQALEAENKA